MRAVRPRKCVQNTSQRWTISSTCRMTTSFRCRKVTKNCGAKNVQANSSSMAHEIQLSQENLPSQIRRNIKGGLLIGLVLAAWKFKGSYQDILRSASIDVTRIRGQEPSEITITVHSSSKQYHIFTNPRIRFLVAFLRYFKNYRRR